MPYNYYNVVLDLPEFQQEVFVFLNICFKDLFPTKFPIIAVRALRQGKEQIQNGFKSDFLGPYDGYKCQATKILDLKILCTTSAVNRSRPF